MKYCPITYEILEANQKYSPRGLHLLSPKLSKLKDLEYSAEEQRNESIKRVGKMSIQGVQLKLSAQIKTNDSQFELVDQNGRYILKPQSRDYHELPENEAVTMSMAAVAGIEVPLHGLIYSKDKSMTYFIKRFDRIGHKRRLSVEDFAQLSGLTRDVKYESSMEKVASLIVDNNFVSFPIIEAVKLFRLTLFNFIVGNEDMHLKNFSLITRANKVELSPAYDLLNTSIVSSVKEEIALPLNGKKNNLRKNDFFKYFGQSRLGLNEKVIGRVAGEIHSASKKWKDLLERCFLSDAMKKRYSKILNDRLVRLEL